MLKTSIETIGGALCTVIKKPFDAVAVRKSLAMGVPVVVELLFDYAECLYTLSGTHYCGDSGELISFKTRGGRDIMLDEIQCVQTILPALPKHPKPDDAALLYRYASEGVFARGATKSWVDGECGGYWTRDNDSWLLGVDAAYIYEIAHAIDTDGNRVEVAIKD